MTAADLAEARAWCADVVADPDTVDGATDADVLSYVERHYCGGLTAFLANA